MNTEDLEVSVDRLSKAIEESDDNATEIREGLEAVSNSIDSFTEAFKNATQAYFDEWVRQYRNSRGG